MTQVLPDRRECLKLAEEYGTPLLVLLPSLITNEANRILAQMSHVHCGVQFAVKCASSPMMLRSLIDTKVSLDIASEMEFEVARRLGFSADRLDVFSPGMRTAFMKTAVDSGATITLDSSRQADELIRMATPRAKIHLRLAPELRITSDDAVVVSLGENKLGLGKDGLLKTASRLQMAGYCVCGLHAHIGSLVRRLSAYIELAYEMAEVADQIDGVEILNLGGGYPIAYADEEGSDFDFSVLERGLQKLQHKRSRNNQKHLRFVIEPGRAVAAKGALVITRVEDVKHLTGGRRAAIADARLQSLGLSLPVLNCNGSEGESGVTFELYGTACTPFDSLTSATVPCCRAGDFLVIGLAGAYVIPIEGSLHLRPKAKEIWWSGPNTAEVARIAPTANDFIRYAI